MRVRWVECVLPAAALVVALAAGGCSMSFPLSSLMPGADDKEETETQSTQPADQRGDRNDVTGSLSLQSARAGNGASSMTSADWTLATAALREALNGKDEDAQSIPWQNPTTGARGTVTPVAAAYLQDGFACRNFLASHVRSGRENWIQGTACRVHRGQWEIRSSRPLEKS